MIGFQNEALSEIRSQNYGLIKAKILKTNDMLIN